MTKHVIRHYLSKDLALKCQSDRIGQVLSAQAIVAAVVTRITFIYFKFNACPYKHLTVKPSAKIDTHSTIHAMHQSTQQIPPSPLLLQESGRRLIQMDLPHDEHMGLKENPGSISIH